MLPSEFKQDNLFDLYNKKLVFSIFTSWNDVFQSMKKEQQKMI